MTPAITPKPVDSPSTTTVHIYQKAFEHALNPIAILDRSFNFIYVNILYAQADQKDISDFPGHNHFELYPNAENEALFQQVVKTKKPYFVRAKPFNYAYNPERGVTFWDWSLVPVLDDRNEVEFLILSLSNVTEHILENIKLEKLTEKLKEEVNERKKLAAIVESSNDPIITMTLEGKITSWNLAAERLYGYNAQEVMEAHISKLVPEGFSYEHHILESIRKGEIVKSYETIRKTKFGQIINVSLTFSPLMDEDGKVLGVSAIVRDITQKKQFQEQMLKLDRLHLVGEMAAGISHEVRNPMTTVRGFLQVLRDKKDFNNYKDYFDLMIEELDRANIIITEFLSIGHNAKINLQKENLNDIIESIKPLIEASALEQDKYLETELSEVPDLLLNHKEIRQVLLNLCKNGFEAMSAGLSLKIRTFCREGQVILAVQDEGEGIKPELMKKLGTPFITTKETGTGLGLGVCYGIAARHNADISFETGPKGTTFFVQFNI